MAHLANAQPIADPSQIEPSFEIPESFALNFNALKLGSKIQAILNYTVIEKTKSFTILRIDSLYPLPITRKF